MTNPSKAELRRLAEAATANAYPRGVRTDCNGRPVVTGDGSWQILSAWHTPDGKGLANAQLAAACSPAAVLSLLDECDRKDSLLEEYKRGGRCALELLEDAEAERDAALAELEACRKDARRWWCVRNAVQLQSPYAVWREGSHPVLGKDADELVDNFLAQVKEAPNA